MTGLFTEGRFQSEDRSEKREKREVRPKVVRISWYTVLIWEESLFCFLDLSSSLLGEIVLVLGSFKTDVMGRTFS